MRRGCASLPNVTFCRAAPDVRPVYRNTQLLLVPSQWEEPFGRVVVEAQSSGIPCIARDVGGLREAVGDGGFLMPPSAGPSEWAEVVESVLENRATDWPLFRRQPSGTPRVRSSRWSTMCGNSSRSRSHTSKQPNGLARHRDTIGPRHATRHRPRGQETRQRRGPSGPAVSRPSCQFTAKTATTGSWSEGDRPFTRVSGTLTLLRPSALVLE